MDEKTYKKYWDIWCKKYDPKNIELEYIKKLVDLKDKRILEIGCGNGRLTRILGKYAKTVVGIDNDKKMIDSAKQNTKQKNISFKSMNALDLKFKDETFDIVIFTWTLVCLYKKETAALKQAKRVLKKNGTLLLVEPGENSDYGTIVKPYLKKNSKPIGIKASYEIPLKKNFKKDFQKIGPIKVPYCFNNVKQTTDVFKFAIEEWHGSKVNDYEKLKKVISKYKQINESVYFYGVSK